MERFFKGLNKEQKLALENINGPMLIVAGAGSGKTRVITHKIAYLIASSLSKPREVTAVTFTNKATAEMNVRISQLLSEFIDPFELKQLTIATFHSYCARVLREHIDKLGISRDFVIYDSDDQRALISKLLDIHDIDKKDITPKSVVSIFSSAKNAQGNIRPGSRLEKVYQDYQSELKKANALDFGDLLLYTKDLFLSHPDVLNIYQDRAKYLFVDEYQDTNRIQYKIIKMLSSKHRNICVVGDEDQSIYKWRGADIRNILDFEKDFPDSRMIKLEENYRSTSNIIGASSSLISKNFQRKDKTLFTNNPKGSKVHVASLVNDISESEYITDQINKLRASGLDYNDIAILYRINAQSRLLEESFRKSRVPYKIIGGTRFYDRKEVRDVIAYLKLLANPEDNVSLERIVNIPVRGIGKATMEKLYKKAFDSNTSLYRIMSNVETLNELNAGARKKIELFIQLINEFYAMCHNKVPASTILKTIIDRIDYFEYLKSLEGVDIDDRIDNVMELISAIADFEEKTDNKSITAFLESISLLGDESSEKGDNNGVKLMTLHSAKGLEFPVVFIIGLEHGLLPYIGYGMEELNDIEEERRLFYVGMTRAMKHLYVSWARSRRIFGGIKARKLSDFIMEIDEQFTEHYDDQNSYYESSFSFKQKPKRNNVSNSSYQYIPEETVEETTTCRVGSKVQHATYGEGIIRSVEGKGEKAKVTVHFRNYGVKKLILGYANLVGC